MANDITQGYQPLPKDKWGCDITPTEEADKDCICCWGEGEVQCSFGDSYYYDTCYCVLVKYWKNIGNKFMADGMEKLLANVIRVALYTLLKYLHNSASVELTITNFLG